MTTALAIGEVSGAQVPSCFVTGTDTEIGKTLVSMALLYALGQRGLRVSGMKPVSAGAEWLDGQWRNEDVEALSRTSTTHLPSALVAPYQLRTAAAPHIAGQLEGVQIDLDHILSCFSQVRLQSQAVVVEGVGGFRVPLTPHVDTADMAQSMGLPVVLVVGLRLGCISQALLTADAIAARGLVLAGWVANTLDPQMPHMAANIDALQSRLAAPLMGHLPRFATATAAAAAARLNISVLTSQRVAAENPTTSATMEARG